MDEALLKLAQDKVDYEAAHDPAVKQILRIVEDFLKVTQVLCYGGTAINNLLPPEDRFYDPEYDIPDYDFYSKEPQVHALRLADKYSKLGFKSVEVKPGSHLMTYKVFVNFMGVADITYLEPKIFDKLWKENIHRGGIHYVTPNFLRMSMYLELSRPRGDVSRWKKVYDRLMLLNKHYTVGCIQDETPKLPSEILTEAEHKAIEKLVHGRNIVLLGSHAIELHSKSRKNLWNVPVDVLTPAVDDEVKKFVGVFGDDKVKAVAHPPYAELLPEHVDILDKKTGSLRVRIFQTVGCHSYHDLKNGLKVASIPTLLQFFMGFVYADAHFLEGYDENRIVCITQRLVDLAHSKKASRRFELLTPLDCIGKQATLRDIKEHTSEIKEKTSKKSSDFLRFFFTYKPGTLSGTQKQKLRRSLKETMRRPPRKTDADLVSDKSD
jgi:hypothetical protein